MKYFDGQLVKIGDRVKLWEECQGVVVCSIDTGEYCSKYPKNEWEYLKTGVLFYTDKVGLVHYPSSNEDLVLISRGA